MAHITPAESGDFHEGSGSVFVHTREHPVPRIKPEIDELETYAGKWANLWTHKDGTTVRGFGTYDTKEEAQAVIDKHLKDLAAIGPAVHTNSDGKVRHVSELLSGQPIPVSE